MRYVFQIILCKIFAVLQISSSLDKFGGQNKLNVYCRDNENRPVDWWFMYKPPVDFIPYRHTGLNFTYIKPGTVGRWETSSRYITANSMLQHTLAPMFRTDVGSAMGVLMADQRGGVWVGHTIPGLLAFSENGPTIAEEEYVNGHLLTCLSLDIVTLNEVALVIRNLAPRYTRIQMPMAMRSFLPAWNFLDGAGWKGYQELPKGIQPEGILEFTTVNKSLRATFLVRKPSDRNCLFKRFAQRKKLVLDVYGHKEQTKPFCGKDYSVRNIESISMKNTDFVYYIRKSRDRAGFAVSTAAHWQRTGASGRDQYWACIGSLDDFTNGGLLLCVEDYSIWSTFDHFKVKEPE